MVVILFLSAGLVVFFEERVPYLFYSVGLLDNLRVVFCSKEIELLSEWMEEPIRMKIRTDPNEIGRLLCARWGRKWHVSQHVGSR